MEPVRLRYLISALFILALAGYNFATYTLSASQQSTFNLQPGLTHDFMATRTVSDSVAGQFMETSGNPVSFYILTSAQFAAFQIGASFNDLYSIVDSSSANFAYTFPAQDTFYLLFRHGTGLVYSTETIYFQRTYTTHNTFRLMLGLIFLLMVAAEFVYVFRRPKPSSHEPDSKSLVQQIRPYWKSPTLRRR